MHSLLYAGRLSAGALPLHVQEEQPFYRRQQGLYSAAAMRPSSKEKTAGGRSGALFVTSQGQRISAEHLDSEVGFESSRRHLLMVRLRRS